MRSYVLIEGHGETDAVANLLARLARQCAPDLPPFASPIRVPVAPENLILGRNLDDVTHT
jgi:hypothetical protein